jgi:hypothetical protein
VNTKIRELATEAFEPVPWVWEEKFGELIIEEVLRTCEHHPTWTGRMVGEHIKQHFGVK